MEHIVHVIHPETHAQCDSERRQYLRPGWCRRDPWHDQMDKFLLSYFIVTQFGPIDNSPRGIVDGAIFGTPKPLVVGQPVVPPVVVQPVVGQGGYIVPPGYVVDPYVYTGR